MRSNAQSSNEKDEKCAELLICQSINKDEVKVKCFTVRGRPFITYARGVKTPYGLCISIMLKSVNGRGGKILSMCM